MNHGTNNRVEPRTQLQKVGIDEGVQMEPTTHETTDSSTWTTPTSTVVEGEVDTLVDSPIPISFTEQLIM